MMAVYVYVYFVYRSSSTSTLNGVMSKTLFSIRRLFFFKFSSKDHTNPLRLCIYGDYILLDLHFRQPFRTFSGAVKKSKTRPIPLPYSKHGQ